MIRSGLPQNITYLIRNMFHEKAVEMGCDITITSKGHPGRRVVYCPSGFSKSLAQLWVFPHLGCQARAPREMYSAVPNAERLENTRYGFPLVTADIGTPKYLDKRVKYLNCSYLSLDEIVENVDGEYINVDQILQTGWPAIDNSMGTICELTESIPYEEGDTLESIREKIGDRYGDQVAISLGVESDGAFYSMNWDISYIEHQDCRMAFKLCNPDAVKGFTVPERILLVEKRQNEDFFRPIYYCFPSEAVVKKEATRSVLRMLISRLGNKVVSHDVTREQFPAYLSSIRDNLREIGDDGYSDIYMFTPVRLEGKAGETMKALTEVKMLGFSTEGNKIVPISETSIGSLYGDLTPLVDKTGAPVRAVVGEVAVMRMPEDEDFGEEVRTADNHRKIKLDPFGVLGKPNLKFPVDNYAKHMLKFLIGMHDAIANTRTREPQPEDDYE